MRKGGPYKVFICLQNSGRFSAQFFFTILFNRNCGLKHEVGLLRLQEKNLEKNWQSSQRGRKLGKFFSALFGRHSSHTIFA